MRKQQSAPVVVRKKSRSRGSQHIYLDKDFKEQVRKLREEERLSWNRIAIRLHRCQETCRKDYGYKRGQDSKKPTTDSTCATAFTFNTIVTVAEDRLIKSGIPISQVAIMQLDEKMLKANTLLHAEGLPQLGRKPEWLVNNA